MSNVDEESLVWYKSQVDVFAYPVRDHDEYDIVFFFRGRKIGTLRLDGLELASWRGDKLGEVDLNFKSWLA